MYKLLFKLFYVALVFCNPSVAMSACRQLQKIDALSDRAIAVNAQIDKNIVQNAQYVLVESAKSCASAQFKADVQHIIHHTSSAQSNQEIVALLAPLVDRYQVLSSLSGPAHIIESYKAQFKIIDEFKKTFLPSTKNYSVSSNVATVLGRDVA